MRPLTTNTSSPRPQSATVADRSSAPQFQEQYVRQGIEGGKRAAYALRAAVADACSDFDPEIEISAKVVANLTGLARAMARDGCLDTPSDLKDFTLGFTQAKASFDFIDVGYGKERADSKIRGEFSLDPRRVGPEGGEAGFRLVGHAWS